MIPDQETFDVIIAGVAAYYSGWIGLVLRPNISIPSNRLNKSEWCWMEYNNSCTYPFDFLQPGGFNFWIEEAHRCALLGSSYPQLADVHCTNTTSNDQNYDTAKKYVHCEFLLGRFCSKLSLNPRERGKHNR